MVMTIVLILIAVSVTSYQQIQLKARETVLKQNLVSMRKAIDEYAADREKLPASLEDLVSAKYINEVPLDPITESVDTWIVISPPDSKKGAIFNVKSGATGNSTSGKPYGEF